MPVAALLVGPKVAAVLEQGSGTFINGFTYQAHPLACAAALAVQDIIQQDGLLLRVTQMGGYLEARLREALGQHPYVGDIRGKGLFWGIELVKDRETKEPFNPQQKLAFAVAEAALEGSPPVMVYPGQGCAGGVSGDHLILSPPYTIGTQEVDVLVEAVQRAIDVTVERIEAADESKWGE